MSDERDVEIASLRQAVRELAEWIRQHGNVLKHPKRQLSARELALKP